MVTKLNTLSTTASNSKPEGGTEPIQWEWVMQSIESSGIVYEEQKTRQNLETLHYYL